MKQRTEVTALKIKIQELQQSVVYYWNFYHSCPCGARPESPKSHPHVMGCPVGEAVISLAHSDLEDEKKSNHVKTEKSA